MQFSERVTSWADVEHGWWTETWSDALIGHSIELVDADTGRLELLHVVGIKLTQHFDDRSAAKVYVRCCGYVGGLNSGLHLTIQPVENVMRARVVGWHGLTSDSVYWETGGRKP